MEVIARPRGEGKTTELIKTSAKTGDIIVAVNPTMVKHIQQMAKWMGLNIPDPITYDEYLEGQIWQGKTFDGFLIDDLDLLLFKILPPYKPVRAVTISTCFQCGKQ